LRAAESSKDFTLPPNRGGWATMAVSMPGRWMSWVNTALPVVLATLSVRGLWRPISL
jgi:hypothetical protein